jgi:hypothetical protein
MKLRWHITSTQSTENGPYVEERVLQFWSQRFEEWEDVEIVHAPEIRYDGKERGDPW